MQELTQGWLKRNAEQALGAQSGASRAPAVDSPPASAASPINARGSGNGDRLRSPRSGAGTPSAGTPSRLEARHFRFPPFLLWPHAEHPAARSGAIVAAPP